MAQREAPSSPPRAAGEIVAHLRAGGAAVVALSGGVDSSAVAALARSALGDRMLAATVVSASVSDREVDAARSAARFLGVRHRMVEAEPLADDRYRANGADRCYRCRSVEARALRSVGAEIGALQYLDGIHLDDLGDDRPGIRAMDEAGFAHPLLWAGWRKADIRRYARGLALPTSERPSNACLASRVARGDAISGPLLRRIDRAEGVLLDLGFRRVRVRVRGDVARVEVGAAEVGRLEDPWLRAELSRTILGLGFAAVEFDPLGHVERVELPIVR